MNKTDVIGYEKHSIKKRAVPVSGAMCMLTREQKQEICQKFTNVPTGVVSDAMDNLNLPCGVITGLWPINKEYANAVGFAVTIKQAIKLYTEIPAIHSKVIEDELQDNDVLVIDVGGETEICSGGEILVGRAKTKGSSGWLVNGALRDIDEIRKLNYPVHVLGTSPRRSKGHMETIGTNVPVSIKGVQINPEDLLVMDETGIVCISQNDIEAVYAEVLNVQHKEAGIHAQLEVGNTLRDAKVVS